MSMEGILDIRSHHTVAMPISRMPLREAGGSIANVCRQTCRYADKIELPVSLWEFSSLPLYLCGTSSSSAQSSHHSSLCRMSKRAHTLSVFRGFSWVSTSHLSSHSHSHWRIRKSVVRLASSNLATNPDNFFLYPHPFSLWYSTAKNVSSWTSWYKSTQPIKKSATSV